MIGSRGILTIAVGTVALACAGGCAAWRVEPDETSRAGASINEASGAQTPSHAGDWLPAGTSTHEKRIDARKMEQEPPMRPINGWIPGFSNRQPGIAEPSGAQNTNAPLKQPTRQNTPAPVDTDEP